MNIKILLTVSIIFFLSIESSLLSKLIYIPPEGKIIQSDIIARVTIVKKQKKEINKINSAKNIVYYTAKITDFIKGKSKTESITIESCIGVEDCTIYNSGDDVIIFLKKKNNNAFITVNNSFGKFKIINNIVDQGWKLKHNPYRESKKIKSLKKLTVKEFKNLILSYIKKVEKMK